MNFAGVFQLFVRNSWYMPVKLADIYVDVGEVNLKQSTLHFNID